MVALFKDRSPAAVVWLLLLSMIAHAHFFIAPPVVDAPLNEGFISLLLNKPFIRENSIAIIGIYHLVVLAQALRLNHLFNDQRMFTRSNYLAAMAYILIIAIFPEWNNLTPALIANFFVIWIFALTIKLYNNQSPKTLVFNIGLLIGCTILLYHPAALLVLVAFFALLVVRPFNVAELLVLGMGIVAPSYFFGAYLFLTDQFHLFVNYLPRWGLNLPDVRTSVLFIISVVVIVLLLCIGIFHWQNKSRRMLIQVRKNWGVLLAMLIIMLPLPFIHKDATLSALLVLAVPVCPFIANGFLAPKNNKLPNVMFWVMVLLVVANNWLPFFKN